MKKYLLQILTIFITLLSAQCVIAAIDGNGVSKEGTTYYTTTAYTDGSSYYTFGDNLDINLPYPSNYVSFQACAQNASVGTKTLSIDQYISGWSSTGYTTPTLNNNEIKNEGSWLRPNYVTVWKWTDYNTDKISTSATQIAFKNNGGTLSRYIRNIKVRMANHILLNTPANGSTNDLGEVEIGKSATLDVKFKSFLVNKNLTVTSNNSFFTINGNTTYTITTTADPFCSTSERKFDFTITYQPTSAGNHSATITISDGTNNQTITVTGSGKRKQNTINWNDIKTQIPVGESISLENVTSTSKGNITFTSSAPEIIKVENNKLVALAEGKATITATIAETNEYTSAVSTLEFEATQKTIQNIIWNQDFYLLKLGDANITLNAYATDKETGIANSNTIEYSVENTNVVTITDSILHIVGKGQTTITAHQRGNETYAEAYMTKIISVREVSNSCEDFLAVNAPDKVEKGNDGIFDEEGGWNWDAFEVTHKLKTIGDKLNFVTSCTSGATRKEIIVKDQNGTEIYNSNDFGTISNLQLNRDVTAITISVKSNLTRSISNIYVTPAIYVEKNRESITFTDTEIGISSNEIVNIDWANQPDGLWATIENDNNNVFSVTRNEYFGGSCGDYDKTPVEVEFLAQEEGDFSAELVIYMGYENPVEKHRIPLYAKSVYRETTFNKDGDWDNPANWTGGIPTGTGKNATIDAAVTIPNEYSAIANNITITNNGSITITPQGKLKANNIIGSNGTNITLQADENGSAILLFKNDENNKVNAIVQLYSKASSDGLRNGQAGNFKDPKWQYLGITAEEIKFTDINPDGTSNWIYRWDEQGNATSCWAEKLKTGSILSAWTGYCLAQESASTYTYSGKLVNSNHTYPLTYTPSENSSDDLGNNLITNSYTAPIDITTLSDANFHNAEANLYIYNTGSYLEWKELTSTEGFGPGQIVVIPANVVSNLDNEYPRTISSGQAFFVKAKNNEATFNINYEENIYNSARKENIMRAKKLAETSNNFNTLKIQITSSTSNDRLYLIEHENTTDYFDNGYDAEKIFDNPNGPQIYATTPFGYASISTNSSFDGQTIGFVANNENEIYTMTFNTEKLHSYDELYIYDTETEIYIDILNEETYQFYASTTPNDKRFYITSNKSNTPGSDTPTNIEKTTWDDIVNENQPIYIYSITGQLIGEYQTIANFKSQIINYPIGIYTIKSGNKTLKITTKKN